MLLLIIFCAYGVLYGASTSLPGAAAIVVRLRRLSIGPGHVSGRNLRGHYAAGRRLSAGRGVDARWLIADGLLIIVGRQLLDVADESGDQPDVH